MNILCACEESQAVTIEMRRLGHNAFSCDLEPCSGGHPEWHIQQDVLPLINGDCEFTTCDGALHKVPGEWDMLIAFPPCTYLSNAGAARLYPQKGELNVERYKNGLEGKAFFMNFYNAKCEKIAIENPIPTRVFNLPRYTQTIQPYEHGHEYSKKTCLWLKGLQMLTPTMVVVPKLSWVSGGSKDNNGNQRKNKGTTFRDAKTRSKTFPGIARAMAEQWAEQAT